MMHESMQILTSTLRAQPNSENKDVNLAICKCLAVCTSHWALPADDLVPAILAQFEATQPTQSPLPSPEPGLTPTQL